MSPSETTKVTLALTFSRYRVYRQADEAHWYTAVPQGKYG